MDITDEYLREMLDTLLKMEEAGVPVHLDLMSKSKGSHVSMTLSKFLENEESLMDSWVVNVAFIKFPAVVGGKEEKVPAPETEVDE